MADGQKNVYLFSVGGATIYADLEDVVIANDPSGHIVVDKIIAWLGRNKKVDFQLRYNGRPFTWRYRYTKVSAISEMYLVGRPRTNLATSDAGRGVIRNVTHDGIVFTCEWRDRIPANLVTVAATNLMVVKAEEPNNEED